MIKEQNKTFCSNDWMYRSLNNESIEIALYQGNSTQVTIPENIDGLRVTRIGDKAFYQSEIQDVMMPDSITEIGDSCFSQCLSLETAKFSSNLISIGAYAFSETKIMKNDVKLPDTVQTIGNFAFSNCRRSGTFTFQFGENMTNLGIGLFYDSFLGKIVLPNKPLDMRGVLYTDGRECSNLQVDLGKSNKYFVYEDGVLFNNKKSVIYHSSYVYKETENFLSYTEYFVPNSVQEIGPQAFTQRYTLRSLSVPTGLKIVGKDMLFRFEELNDMNNYADYSYDTRIKKLTIRDQVIDGIKQNVLINIPTEGKQNLLDETRQYFKMNKDGTFFDLTAYDNSFAGRTSKVDKILMATCRLKAPLRLSDEHRLQYNRYLAKNSTIVVLMALQSKNMDLDDDDGLCMPMRIIITEEQHNLRNRNIVEEGESNIDLLCNLKAISESAIDELIEKARENKKEEIEKKLTDYKVNQLHISIDKIFEKKTVTKSKAIDPNSAAEMKKFWNYISNEDGTVTITGCKYTFIDTKNISLKIPGKIGKKDVIGVGLSKTNNYHSHYEAVDIPEGITKILDNAFEGMRELDTVTLPTTVSEIGCHAFAGCSKLKNINIPNGVDKIGYDTFIGCNELITLDIPKSVTSIGRAAFYNCTKLSTINIPENVTEIGETTFFNCSSLRDVSISNGVIEIGEEAFSKCTELVNVSIPDSVTKIGASAFKNCTSLQSIIIPGSVEKIEKMAFKGCSKLKNVILQSDMTEIGKDAFKDTLFVK